MSLTLADLIPLFLFMVSVYERWLWRWSPLHRIGLLGTPVVIGTWRGDLESFWVDPKTDQRPPVKTVYLVIAQTATTVSVRLLSNESSSVQTSGVVGKDDAGYPVISYNYRNTPDLKFREDNPSPIHFGGAILKIEGDPATALDGWYWTRPQEPRRVPLPRALARHRPDLRPSREAHLRPAATGRGDRRTPPAAAGTEAAQVAPAIKKPPPGEAEIPLGLSAVATVEVGLVPASTTSIGACPKWPTSARPRWTRWHRRRRGQRMAALRVITLRDAGLAQTSRG